VENGGFEQPLLDLLPVYDREKEKITKNETRILSLKEQYAKLGGMKEANAIETTPKDSISIDNVVNTSAPIDSTNQN
jgi:penicillin-binding protein 2